MKKKISAKLAPVIALALGVVVGLCFSIPAIAQNISEYKMNKNGLTYGTMEYVSKNPMAKAPDLIACAGIDGTIGYCYKSDLDGELPANPEEAVKYMEELDKQISEAIANGEQYLRYIPLYDSDGETVIGKFGIGNPFAGDSKASGFEEIFP